MARAEATGQRSRRETAESFLRAAASGNVRKAFATYVSEDFRHHNPLFRGDADSLATAMEQAHHENANKSFEVQHSLQDGDLVAVHSRVVKQKGPDIAVVHLFRFEDGRIAELWDLPMPLPADSPNENGAF